MRVPTLCCRPAGKLVFSALLKEPSLMVEPAAKRPLGNSSDILTNGPQNEQHVFTFQPIRPFSEENSVQKWKTSFIRSLYSIWQGQYRGRNVFTTFNYLRQIGEVSVLARAAHLRGFAPEQASRRAHHRASRGMRVLSRGTATARTMSSRNGISDAHGNSRDSSSVGRICSWKTARSAGLWLGRVPSPVQLKIVRSRK